MESAVVSDFAHDPYTGFFCASFKRRTRADNFATVACFDTEKHKPYSAAKFSAFPSLVDHQLPDDQMTPVVEVPHPMTQVRAVVVDEDMLFEKSSQDHSQRLFGRSSMASPQPRVVSQEDGQIEGNENLQTGFVDNKMEHHSHHHQHHTTPDIFDKPTTPKPLHSAQEPVVQRKPYHFISVAKIHFDECGRLWFLDCGTAFEGSNREQFFRRPILWSFRLAVTEDRRLTNRLFLRYELTTNITHNGITDFAVDIHGDTCDEFHVYMANSMDNNIIVYNHDKNEDYPVTDEAMMPVKSDTGHTFLGQEYPHTGGVASLSLGELKERRHSYRDVYFTLASGSGHYVINSKALKKRPSNKNIQMLGYRGCKSNTLNHAYDSLSKVMFYVHPETKSVRCWNTNQRLTPDNVGTVFVDDQLSTGWSIKIDHMANLWFISNDFNYFTNEQLTSAGHDPLNVYRGKVKDVINGTVCANIVRKSSNANNEDEEEDDLTWDSSIDAFLQQLLNNLLNPPPPPDVDNSDEDEDFELAGTTTKKAPEDVVVSMVMTTTMSSVTKDVDLTGPVTSAPVSLPETMLPAAVETEKLAPEAPIDMTPVDGVQMDTSETTLAPIPIVVVEEILTLPPPPATDNLG